MKKEVIPRPKISSVLDIDELWKKYHEVKRNENGELYRNQLIEHYRNLVRYAAERLHRKLPDSVELDNLISAGINGLEDAIENFNSSRNVKFETYCSSRIKGTMLDYLRNTDWVPRLMRARANLLKKVESRIMLETGRKPTDEELIEELSKDKYKDNSFYSHKRKGIKKAKRILKDSRNIKNLISYDRERINDYGEREMSGIDFIKDKKALNPVTELQKKELKEMLTKGLTRAEKLVIISYYYEKMTMKEIGATLELSESRVSMMHSSIMARLKSKLTENNRKSQEVMEEIMYQN